MKQELQYKFDLWYQTTRRADKYEPLWVWSHCSYIGEEEMPQFLENTKTLKTIQRIMGIPGVYQDGMLIGSTSWVFLGRRNCDPIEFEGAIIISRTLSKPAIKKMKKAGYEINNENKTMWMAYKLDDPSYEIGACDSLREVKHWIKGGEAEVITYEEGGNLMVKMVPKYQEEN